MAFVYRCRPSQELFGCFKIESIMRKLCFIIPMYNAENVIERTLRSILNTNLPPDFYEVIVVDDGSTDAGLDVIKGLMHLFPNLKTIVQENAGSSKARNAGLRETLADYVWFIDADDMVEKDISCVPQLIDKHPAVDVFSYAYNWVSENGQHLGYGQLQEKVKHEIELSGREAILQGKYEEFRENFWKKYPKEVLKK